MDEEKRISRADMQRCDKYHDEYCVWLLQFYSDAGSSQRMKDFIEKHKEDYPRLALKHMAFRISARDYFNEHVYSLRNNVYKREPLPTEMPTWLK